MIPPGQLRTRSESQIADVRSDPLPADLMNAYSWADSKGLSHNYVRSLIKSKEGSLPLVGGTLQYSREGLEALWRADVQLRREKGIKKSSAARFKAERMKLAVAELESFNSDLPAKTVALSKEVETLREDCENLIEKLQESEFTRELLEAQITDLKDQLLEFDIDTYGSFPDRLVLQQRRSTSTDTGEVKDEPKGKKPTN